MGGNAPTEFLAVLLALFSLIDYVLFSILKISSPNYFARGFLDGAFMVSLVFTGVVFLAAVFSGALSKGVREIFSTGRSFAYAKKGKLALAAILLAVLSLATATAVSRTFDPEIFWKLGLFFKEPLGCFAGNLGGNYAIGGSFFPTYAGTFSLVFGNSALSLALSGGFLASLGAFLAYLCAKRIYGEGPALFLAASSIVLVNYFPLIDISDQETGMQAILSLLVLFVFLSGDSWRTSLASPLFWLVSGIGFLNKLFFLTFLSAGALALGVLWKGAFRWFRPRTAAVSLALFLLGAFPFIYYNISEGFPSASAFAEVGKNALNWEFISRAVAMRAEQLAPAVIPFRGGFEYVQLALVCAIFLLPFFFRKAIVDLRKHSFVLLVALFFFSLSILSYSDYFDPRQLSAITPVFFILFAGAFASVPERFEAGLPVLLLILSILAYPKLSSGLGSFGDKHYHVPAIGADSGRIFVTSCVEGAIAPYFLPEKEAVLATDVSTEACDSDAMFILTAQKSYIGEVRTDSEKIVDRFISECVSEGRQPLNYSNPNIGTFYFWEGALAELPGKNLS